MVGLAGCNVCIQLGIGNGRFPGQYSPDSRQAQCPTCFSFERHRIFLDYWVTQVGEAYDAGVDNVLIVEPNPTTSSGPKNPYVLPRILDSLGIQNRIIKYISDIQIENGRGVFALPPAYKYIIALNSLQFVNINQGLQAIKSAISPGFDSKFIFTVPQNWVGTSTFSDNGPIKSVFGQDLNLVLNGVVGEDFYTPTESYFTVNFVHANSDAIPGQPIEIFNDGSATVNYTTSSNLFQGKFKNVLYVATVTQ